MEHTYSFTCHSYLDDSVKWEGADGIPILDQITRWLYERDYRLHNRKVTKLRTDFCHTTPREPGKMITHIKLEAPPNATFEIALGGQTVPVTNFEELETRSFPYARYHEISIQGSVPRENDTVTITYRLEPITSPFQPFRLGNHTILLIEGMYGVRYHGRDDPQGDGLGKGSRARYADPTSVYKKTG